MSKDLELDELFGGRSKMGRKQESSGPSESGSDKPIPAEEGTAEAFSKEPVRRTGRPAKPIGERYVDHIKRAAYYIDIDTLDRLDEFCHRTGITKSEVVREGIALYLEKKNLI
ncbi:MAG: ribbon-helix-helix domain-containing protein [Acidimicrobiaceae bacterium]|nr:ribbon-helix-helix domain-containing protein [Acidimicrobiaceae bacterium]